MYNSKCAFDAEIEGDNEQTGYGYEIDSSDESSINSESKLEDEDMCCMKYNFDREEDTISKVEIAAIDELEKINDDYL